jgi:hypothetical protein
METVKIMKAALGEQTMGRRQLFEWFLNSERCKPG